ncbi:MAG TPA: MBL fold metallo-hydrolase [Oculatellaceae cyanobacterium]
MKITVLGAAQEVTGSCFLIEVCGKRLLIDCGLFQGSRRLERYNFIPKNLSCHPIDAVLLTHGHLDHCGRLPLLFKELRRCPVFSTSATVDISKLILRDAAKIQEDDANRTNRKRRRKEGLVTPLFDMLDVEQVEDNFRSVLYNEWIGLGTGVRARFLEAGHIIGSACIELEAEESDGLTRIVFSGDLGPKSPLLQRSPAEISTADAVFIETTYGDRDHRSLLATWDEFSTLVRRAVEQGGKILIPTFAVGRTQQILYYFSELFRRNIVSPFPIYLDSPMAIAATDVYLRHHRLLREGLHFMDNADALQEGLPSLIPCQTAEQSKELNYAPGPCAILAGAGMCNAGRILHHLRHGLRSPENMVLIVGYQTKGSTGRQLVEGAHEVKIFGETVKVRASIHSLGGFSAHAGQTDLIHWLSPLVSQPEKIPRVILTHGESNAMSQFAFKVEEEFGISCQMPKLGDVIELGKLCKAPVSLSSSCT